VSESRLRQYRMSGSMRGRWSQDMVRILRHCQAKAIANGLGPPTSLCPVALLYYHVWDLTRKGVVAGRVGLCTRFERCGRVGWEYLLQLLTGLRQADRVVARIEPTEQTFAGGNGNV